MIIDCVADLHGHYPDLGGGDLLIVAGDLTKAGKMHEYSVFADWIRNQPYRYKVVVAGNHDRFLEHDLDTWLKMAKNHDFYYLQDSGISVDGYRIWGSPWSRAFKGMNPLCKAFTCDTEEELQVKFDLIPANIDILVTHAPPYWILDSAWNMKAISGRKDLVHVGSKELRKAVERVGPKLHVFGHIHEAYGQEKRGETLFVNCSIMNEHYEPMMTPSAKAEGFSRLRGLLPIATPNV